MNIQGSCEDYYSNNEDGDWEVSGEEDGKFHGTYINGCIEWVRVEKNMNKALVVYTETKKNNSPMKVSQKFGKPIINFI